MLFVNVTSVWAVIQIVLSALRYLWRCCGSEGFMLRKMNWLLRLICIGGGLRPDDPRRALRPCRSRAHRRRVRHPVRPEQEGSALQGLISDQKIRMQIAHPDFYMTPVRCRCGRLCPARFTEISGNFADRSSAPQDFVIFGPCGVDAQTRGQSFYEIQCKFVGRGDGGIAPHASLSIHDQVLFSAQAFCAFTAPSSHTRSVYWPGFPSGRSAIRSACA